MRMHARRMRLAFDEWESSQTGHKPDRAIHRAWIEFVLKETLILPDEVLATGQSIPQTLSVFPARRERNRKLPSPLWKNNTRKADDTLASGRIHKGRKEIQ